jgi:hypothetical protein
MPNKLTRLFATAAGLFLCSALATAAPSNGAELGKPLPAALVAQLRSAGEAGLRITKVPDDGGLQAISGKNPGGDGKVGVLYVGADFCPYCAALRWPLTLALMRFGSFQGLEAMRSNARDVYPDTTTLSFADAGYTSPLVRFQSVETADRDGKQLQSLDGEAAALFKQYDAEPYTSNPGGIPFVDIGGHWLLLGSSVNPQEIGTADWGSIAHELATPSKLAEDVLPQANLITAAICEATGQKPQAVCAAPGVVASAGALPPR